MAFCTEFAEMDKYDQDLYISMLIHVVRVDTNLFNHGKHLIEIGKLKGHFNNVKFGIEALRDIQVEEKIID